MRVAAVHQSPVLLDRAATLDKVVAAIAEAGAADVRLLGFPETFVPGYPYWLGTVPFDEQGALNRRYAEESVRLTAQALGAVGRACARHRVNVVLGISERHGGTLYNTQVFIDDQGEVAGVHRKLQPTLVERAIWGQGDGSTLGVHALGVGRVGGLICGEHSMNLARQASSPGFPSFMWARGREAERSGRWTSGSAGTSGRSPASTPTRPAAS